MGVLSDGLGGIFLILFASFLYPILGFSFSGIYEYVVFTFVSMTGVIHYFALKNEAYENILTKISVVIRIFASSMFFALFRTIFGFVASGYRDWETDRKSTRLNSSHITRSRMPSSA